MKKTHLQNKFTGYYDDNNVPIYVGDTLHSKWGYDVIVTEGENDYYGKLVCDDSHSCKDIPYSLNNGKDHTKLN